GFRGDAGSWSCGGGNIRTSGFYRQGCWLDRNRCAGRQRRAGSFQPQIHAAQTQYLAGFQDGFADALALDEGAIGGFEVADDDFVASQQDFTMPAGDGRLDDLKRVAFSASN